MLTLKQYILNNIEKTLQDPQLSKFFDKIKKTRSIVKHIKTDGDMLLFLKRFTKKPKGKNLELYDKLKLLGYETFEDIVSNEIFISNFNTSVVTKIEDLTIFEKYSSYDIAVAIDNFNIRKGMFKTTNKSGMEIIVVKANIDDISNKYVNTWITKETLKYYLETDNKIYNEKTMTKGPNKEIRRSFINNLKLDIHLFTRNEKKVPYTYMGIFKCINLVEDTYIELTNSKVLISNNKSLDDQQDSFISNEFNLNRARSMEKALEGNPTPDNGYNIVKSFNRDPYVKHYVKDRAKGNCELCGFPAPFKKSDESPYLEVHHLITLSEGGPDTIYNCVALCPNCHRELHYGKIDIKSNRYQKLVKLIYDSLTNDELINKAVSLHEIDIINSK